jgi:CRP-like cAMP-binding protein
MSLDQDIERLASIPMLGVIEPGALRLLAFSGETRILRAGEILFRRGDSSEGGVLILSGSFTMDDSREPKEDRPIFGAGVLLGESALLRETECEATAVARETSTVFKISRTLFLRLLQEHPASANRILAFLAQRLRSRLGEVSKELHAKS